MIFKKSLTPSTCFGLSLTPSSVAAASTNISQNTLGQEQHVSLTQFELSDQIGDSLRSMRDKLSLKKQACYLVLSSTQYQLLLIDKPNVQPEEYTAAALWQAKDMLQYPVEDCIIDVFLPSEQIGLHQDKLYVVATRKSFVAEIVDKLSILDMHVANVTIEEFAIRNLVSQSVFEDLTAVLTYDGEQYLFIIIQKEDILFSRRIKSNIASELYRSLDFFSVTLRQQVISTVYIQDVAENVQQQVIQYCDQRNYQIQFSALQSGFQKYLVSDEPIKLNDVLALGGFFQCMIDRACANAEN